MKTLSVSFLVLILVISCSSSTNKNTINLAGEWSFRIDPESRGISDKWYTGEFPDKMNLPGSMAENGKGDDITVNTKWTGEIVDSSWFQKA